MNCKWYNINDKLIVLVFEEYDKTKLLYSETIYKQGELNKYYKGLYNNNPCQFYRSHIDHKEITIDIPFKKVNGDYIIKLHKQGMFKTS